MRAVWCSGGAPLRCVPAALDSSGTRGPATITQQAHIVERLRGGLSEPGLFRPRRLAALLGTALAYYAAARLGLAFATVNGAVSPVWPPTGVAVALLLLGGRGLAPGVFLGALCANLGAPDSTLPSSLGIALGNTLEPLAASWLLGRARMDLRLGRTRDVLLFALFGAALPAMLSAGFGVTTLWLAGCLAADLTPRALWVWWLGNTMGALLLAPALLQLARLRSWPGRGPETLAALGVTLVVGLVVFLRPHSGDTGLVPAFLLFPLCVWSALRLGPEGAAHANLLLGALCIGGTVQGLGPFGSQARTQDLLLLQLFLGVIAGTALLLAAATRERQRAAGRFALFATTVRSVREGVVISEVLPGGDGNLRIVFANEAFASLLGYGAEELVGRAPRSLCGVPPDPQTRERLDRAQQEGSYLRVEVTLARKDGTLVPTEMQLSPVRDADGRHTHCVATHRDVSALRQLQAKQLVSERIASMATLAAGVGHEINNALAYLS
ncbi:MAG TPA: MASE1 domain-containing protein, partial [Aggregicoccus sp.]|nr:MASE1 domain-containing protein [Aggregicoccus sp.]